MSSINGLKNISTTQISNTGEYRTGTNLDSGVAGQVLTSGGPDLECIWDNNSVAVPNPLSMGTNINLTSGATSWDGSIADTINSTHTDTTYQAGDGISINTLTTPDTLFVNVITNNDPFTVGQLWNSNGDCKVSQGNLLTLTITSAVNIGALTIGGDALYITGDGVARPLLWSGFSPSALTITSTVTSGYTYTFSSLSNGAYVTTASWDGSTTNAITCAAGATTGIISIVATVTPLTCAVTNTYIDNVAEPVLIYINGYPAGGKSYIDAQSQTFDTSEFSYQLDTAYDLTITSNAGGDITGYFNFFSFTNCSVTPTSWEGDNATPPQITFTSATSSMSWNVEEA